MRRPLVDAGRSPALADRELPCRAFAAQWNDLYKGASGPPKLFPNTTDIARAPRASALAILSVIAYHFGCTWVPGGFLGVDTFVVLSGYLITSLLIREFADTHRVKVVTFWARRVRRRFRPSFCCLLRLARGPIG